MTELGQLLSPSDLLPESFWEMDFPGTVSGSDLDPDAASGATVYVLAMAAEEDPVYAENSPFAGFDLAIFLSIMVYALVSGFGLSLLLNLLGWVIGNIKLLLQKGG